MLGKFHNNAEEFLKQVTMNKGPAMQCYKKLDCVVRPFSRGTRAVSKGFPFGQENLWCAHSWFLSPDNSPLSAVWWLHVRQARNVEPGKLGDDGLAVIKLGPSLGSWQVFSPFLAPPRLEPLGRGMAVEIKDGLRKTWELETAAEGWRSWIHGVWGVTAEQAPACSIHCSIVSRATAPCDHPLELETKRFVNIPQSRPSPGWKHLLVLSHLRHYAKLLNRR